MKYKITIPKRGKNAGVADVEGLQKDENCHLTLEDVAVTIGTIKSVEEKDHFDDDAPVFDDVSVNNDDN